jgi:hypothetical protein
VFDSCDWIGIAEQRHEGAFTYPQLDSANDYIFFHVKENGTGNAREGKVRLFVGMDILNFGYVRKDNSNKC